MNSHRYEEEKVPHDQAKVKLVNLEYDLALMTAEIESRKKTIEPQVRECLRECLRECASALMPVCVNACAQGK